MKPFASSWHMPYWGDRPETITHGKALASPDSRMWRVGKQVWPPASVRHGSGTDSGGIPEGSMRVSPNTDAVVWRICPDYKAEL